MIADRAFEYRSVKLQPGDEFDCDDEHVELLKTVRHAHEPSEAEKAGGERQVYSTRVLTARKPGRKRLDNDETSPNS